MRIAMFSLVALFLLAVCLPQGATAGNYASCAGSAVASCAGAAVASCSGSLDVKVRRTPVRSLFARMQERRANRVSARSASVSCAGSAQTKLMIIQDNCPACE